MIDLIHMKEINIANSKASFLESRTLRIAMVLMSKNRHKCPECSKTLIINNFMGPRGAIFVILCPNNCWKLVSLEKWPWERKPINSSDNRIKNQEDFNKLVSFCLPDLPDFPPDPEPPKAS
jgi:hypothetical protein